MDIAGDVLPILLLEEDFACAIHKGAVSLAVALKRVHKPRGGITGDAHEHSMMRRVALGGTGV